MAGFTPALENRFPENADGQESPSYVYVQLELCARACLQGRGGGSRTAHLTIYGNEKGESLQIGLRHCAYPVVWGGTSTSIT